MTSMGTDPFPAPPAPSVVGVGMGTSLLTSKYYEKANKEMTNKRNRPSEIGTGRIYKGTTTANNV